ATVGVTETTVSHALRLLRTAGVVRARRAGRQMYYRLADEHVQRLLELTREHAAHDTERVR
ncbi:MAG: ArsR/SmtB family transcription factor, partial [Actinomycetes bacterium]